MTTQSITSQAASLFGSAAGSVSAKGKQSGSGFNLFIDSSLKATQNTTTAADTTAKKTSAAASVKQDNSDHDTDSAADTKTAAALKDTLTKTDASKVTTQKADTQTKDTKVAVEEKDTDPSSQNDNTVDVKVLAQISVLLQSIQEAVMKSLNLSQDQLNQLLSDQGMTAADLLQTDKLQQLILANSGQTDILAALTDENLADTMKQLLQTVDEIKANNNIGLTGEQIKAILSKVDAQSKAKTDTSKETVTEETPVTAKEDQTEQSEVVNTANVARDTKAKTVTKTVTEKSITTETVKQAVTGESFTGSETGTGSEANSDFNTPNQFQNFVDNLVKASTSTQVDFTGDMVQVTELRQIANQIIDKIKVSIAPNQTSMELQLNPENLGKVSLSVQSKNGEMTAQFIVQNEISKEAIESQMQTLRDALNQQGIKVESIEVTVSANAFEQSSREGTNEQAEAQKDNTGKKITLEEALNMTEATEEENSTNQDVTGITGSMIDYTA